MDGVMMEWVRNNCKNYGLTPIKWEIPWSKLRVDNDESLKEYNMFQEYMNQIGNKKSIYPIEMDFLFWDE